MEHKLLKKCSFLQIDEDGKSRLYRVPRKLTGKTFELQSLNNLSEPQSGLKVYPYANLVVTDYGLFTTQGELLREHNKDQISVIKAGWQWLIIQDSLTDNASRYCLTLWDGYDEQYSLRGQKLILSPKYFALYTSSNQCWSIYTLNCVLRFTTDSEHQDVVLNNNFLITHSVGKHSLYSLHKRNSTQADDYCIFRNQQLILCSSREQFALCADLSGTVQIHYRQKYHNMGKAEQVLLYDKAGLFSIKRNGRIFLYCFDGSPYAENICPYGADMVSYNQEDNTLLIGLNGIFRLLQI